MVSNPGNLKIDIVLILLFVVSSITVKFPKFFIEQARLEVFPLTPITVFPGLSTKYGPDKDPVGLGVALSYSWPRSTPDLQEDLPAEENKSE